MKKLWTLLLCMTMLLSLVTVAQAENTKFLTDTFDTDPLGQVNITAYRGYTSSSGTVSGSYDDVIGSGTSYNGGAAFEITTDSYQGQAMKMTASAVGQYWSIGTESMAGATDETPIYVNLKFKILDDGYNGTYDDTLPGMEIYAGGGTIVNIKAYDYEPTLWPHDDDYLTESVDPETGEPKNGIPTRFKYNLGEWYDLTVKYTSSYTYTTIKDNKGNVAQGRRPKTNDNGVQLLTNNKQAFSMVVDEIYAVQGTDAISFITSDYGTVPVIKTVDVYEDFNFATPTPSNGNITEPFSWYMRVDSPLVASGGLGTNTAGYYASYASVRMVDDCKGGYAPEITTVSGKNPFVSIGAVDITATEKAFISFRARFDDPTTSNFIMGFGSGSGAYEFWASRGGVFESWNYWGRKTYTPIADIWYTFVVEFQEISGVKSATLYVYNDKGEVIMNCAPGAPGNLRNPIDKARVYVTGYGGTSPYCLDDMRVQQVSSTVNSTEFIASEILGKEVSTTLPAIRAEFNQPVAEGSTARFISSDDTEIPAIISYKGASPLVEITPATPLAYGADYILDLSDIRGLDGTALVETSAKTLKITTPPYALGDMTLGELSIDGTTLTVPITFENSAYKEVNAYLIAALYDANGTRLEWVNSKEVKGAEMGENTFTFTNLPEGADVENIRIFAWDNLVTIRPLYK